MLGLLLSMSATAAAQGSVISNTHQRQLDQLIARLPKDDGKKRIGPRPGSFSLAQGKKDGTPHLHLRERDRRLVQQGNRLFRADMRAMQPA